MSEIISRKDAIARGLKRYFTGKPCKWGHITKRRTNNPKCEACAKINSKIWKELNPEKVKEARRRCHLKRRDLDLTQGRLWYRKNKARHLKRNKSWARDHPEKMREYSRKHYRANHQKERARAARLYYEGPLNPKGDRQWLSTAIALNRRLKRLLKPSNLNRSSWLSEDQRHLWK